MTGQDLSKKIIEKNNKDITATPIAVVGMGCHYPGASSPKQLWENVLARRREFRRFLDQRLPTSEYYDPDPTVPDKIYTARAAYLDGFEFNWAERRIPKKAVDSTDIVQWLALDVADRALADAGYSPDTLPRDRTGVVVGNSLTGEQSRANSMRLRWPFVSKVISKAAAAMDLSTALRHQFMAVSEQLYKSVFPEVNEDTLQGALSNTIAGRVANYFDLHGGGYVVDGACSSSLLSVCTAATQLASNEWDIALAGGVDVSLDTFELIGFAKTKALAAGDMHVYDRRGAGFLPGEGCGFVVLKRLGDALAAGDTVYAVVRGWGVSSDGKGGITAPSSDGQALALSRAYEKAGYSACTLDFIEGHGTGTARGDRTELEGIAKAMQAGGDPQGRICGVTSFKSIVGHTKAAAGVGAFIKAVCAVNRRVLPPIAGCDLPNPIFDTAARPLYPILQGEILDPGHRVRAGVSAMGFGGINSHVTLESHGMPLDKLAPDIDERALLASNQDEELFVFAADSIAALLPQVEEAAGIAVALSIGDLTDYAAELSTGLSKTAQIHAAVIAGRPADLSERLLLLRDALDSGEIETGSIWTSPDKNIWAGAAVRRTRVGFLLPGQGSQKLAIARKLVERFEWARALVAMADEIAEKEIGEAVSPYLFRPMDRAKDNDQLQQWKRELARTEIAQPVICLISVLFCRYLAELGIAPAIVGGHSLGELTAYHIAGAFDEPSLFRLAAIRGREMARCSEAKGAMVSLSATELAVRALIEEVDGYLTVANLNSPQQVVVSGEEAAIHKLMECAKNRGVDARLLPVSGAFHSKLMQPAADELFANNPLPQQIENLTSILLSSVDGEAVTTASDMHAHFSKQLLASVNFNSLAQAMLAGADWLIEVGPGGVLSNLLTDITADPDACLPVAAADSGLLRVLAKAFANGCEVRWSALYRHRLVRQFIPTSQRVFIDNPCERLMAEVNAGDIAATVEHVTDTAGGSAVETEIRRHTGLDGAILQNYLSRRGAFLADIVKADINSFIDVAGAAIAGQPTSVFAYDHHKKTSRAAVTTKETAPVSALRTGELSVDNILIDLIVKETGFPADSIALDLRLLDDLNLDSIKVGQLVAAAAREAGVPGELDTAEFVSSTLGEVAAAIDSALGDSGNGSSSKTNGAAGLEDRILDLIAAETGFSKDSIPLDARLLDDLNLDSIKSGKLILTAVGDSGLASKMDVAQFANASIVEIAAAIVAAGRESADPAHPVSAQQPRPGSTAGRPQDWVRNFSVDYRSSPLPEVRKSAALTGKYIIVADEPLDLALVDDLHAQLGASGAEVIDTDYASLPGLAGSEKGANIIGLLPNRIVGDRDEKRRLERMVGRLSRLANSAIAMESRQIGLVQFGEGYFGAGDIAVDPEMCCTTAFARTLSLEHSNLRVRVVDLSGKLPTPGRLVADELGGAESFCATGYTAAGDRLQQRVKMLQPLHTVPRPHQWSAQDVILVTGGAKGITAECALALAEITGARFALVGSTPLPSNGERDPNSEIVKTLGRFDDLGNKYGYYSCNLTDPDAVANMVQQVCAELGVVTAVVHGAGLNQVRLLNSVSAGEAYAEIAPKVLGARYLLQAFETAPPRLLVGFSSIIGVTGMPGNAWYAYANESLDLILRGFAAAHSETDTQSIAYSVWGEVGMGHRMGAVKNLGKLGVGAIPTTEGVQRFLSLWESDCGSKQVIVTGALGELETWRGLRTDIPEPQGLRFVEKIVDVEPGVTMVAQAALSLEGDVYLRDHNFRGSFLFPTVFGLEAMAQVAGVLTGCDADTIVAVEQIDLGRPITVDPARGEQIQLHALAYETDSSGQRRVRVGIRVEQSGFKTDHFAAVLVFGVHGEVPQISSKLPEIPLAIEPETDLYGDFLFQGTLFQRMNEVHFIGAEKIVCGCEARYPMPANESIFSPEGCSTLVLGDPFFRDVLLQSVQLPCVPDIVLPVSIGRIELFGGAEARAGRRIITATLKSKQTRDFIWDVTATDENGRISERLVDYCVRAVNDPSRKGKPSIESLLASKGWSNPVHSDEVSLLDTLNAVSMPERMLLPAIALLPMPNLGAKPKQVRHVAERRLISRAVVNWEKGPSVDGHRFGDVNGDIAVEWLESGKPSFTTKEFTGFGLSITHDADYGLCVFGAGEQGCDIEPIVPRDRDEWLGLLGKNRVDAFNELVGYDDSQDISGYRVWCAAEAIKKATNSWEMQLEVGKVESMSVILKARQENSILSVMTIPIRLSTPPVRMLAVVIGHQCETEDQVHHRLEEIVLNGKEV